MFSVLQGHSIQLCRLQCICVKNKKTSNKQTKQNQKKGNRSLENQSCEPFILKSRFKTVDYLRDLKTCPEIRTYLILKCYIKP